MTAGYLYCFSNESMPGLLKVGMTERTPEIRLNEANRSDTWRPPTPYKIEIAKKVLYPKQKETTLHNLLSQYTERINPNREFFRVSLAELKTFFDLIDGDLWVKDSEEKKAGAAGAEAEAEAEAEDNQSIISNLPVIDMSKRFSNGQRIRHSININKTCDNTWIGIYDSTQNGIIYATKCYKTLSEFAEMHYNCLSILNKIDKQDFIKSANVWKECECEVNGIWIRFSSHLLKWNMD